MLFLEKTMENVRKHRDIKLATTKVQMNKPIYLGMSILDISKSYV